jgi:hypothetical protein
MSEAAVNYDSYEYEQQTPTPEPQTLGVMGVETFDDVMGNAVKAARKEAALERIRQQTWF